MNRLKLLLAAVAGNETLQGAMTLPQGGGPGQAGGVCYRVKICSPHHPRIRYLHRVCR